MEIEPKGGPGLMILAAVGMVICCAAPVLIVGGALTGFGAWLSGGGLTWLVVAAIAVAAGFLLWRRRAGETRVDRGPPKETSPKA